jgi:hypothetical protein
MEIIIIISLVILLALGALFAIPKSQNKGTCCILYCRL